MNHEKQIASALLQFKKKNATHGQKGKGVKPLGGWGIILALHIHRNTKQSCMGV